MALYPSNLDLGCVCNGLIRREELCLQIVGGGGTSLSSGSHSTLAGHILAALLVLVSISQYSVLECGATFHQELVLC